MCVGYNNYNFGDLLRDEKNKEKCIVVDESQCYVWLWYFNMVTNDSVASKTQKEHHPFTVIKRCNVTDDVNETDNN